VREPESEDGCAKALLAATLMRRAAQKVGCEQKKDGLRFFAVFSGIARDLRDAVFDFGNCVGIDQKHETNDVWHSIEHSEESRKRATLADGSAKELNGSLLLAAQAQQEC
jgi:hypothetical protein